MIFCMPFGFIEFGQVAGIPLSVLFACSEALVFMLLGLMLIDIDRSISVWLGNASQE